jgi:hypothetical protein
MTSLSPITDRYLEKRRIGLMARVALDLADAARREERVRIVRLIAEMAKSTDDKAFAAELIAAITPAE